MPSLILIHQTVWSQYTNVTDRQDRTDRLITHGELFYGRPKMIHVTFTIYVNFWVLYHLKASTWYGISVYKI